MLFLQQPETLSLLGDPLYPPRLAKSARAEAEAAFSRAHAAYMKKPTAVAEILDLQRAHLALGRIGDALVVLTHGIEANPDEPALYLERGRGYILIRKFDIAERDLKRATGLPAARCALGLAQYLSGDYAVAGASYADCADAGIFGYLAARRAGRSPGKPPAPEGRASTAPSPIRFPGSVTRDSPSTGEPIAASYFAAIERLLAGDADAARERLKTIVERNRNDWMDPAYIAAEADYARLKKDKK